MIGCRGLSFAFFAPSSSSSSSPSVTAFPAFDPAVSERRAVGVKHAVGASQVVVGDPVEVAAKAAESTFEDAGHAHLQTAFRAAPSQLDAEDSPDHYFVGALLEDR